MIRPLLAGFALGALLLTSPAQSEVSWDLGKSDAVEQAKALLLSDHAYVDEHKAALLVRTDINLGEQTIVQRHLAISYFGTVEGVQSQSNISVSFDSGSEALRFVEAAVVGADGTVHRLDTATAQVLDTDSYDVFTDSREVVLQIPGLAVGAATVVEYERKIRVSDLELPWMTSFYPQVLRPRARVELHVRWPEGQPAPEWVSTYEPLSCELSANALDCLAEHVPAAKLDEDVNYADVLGTVAVTHSQTWDEVIDRIDTGIKQAMADRPALKRKYDALTSDVADVDVEKIAALHRYVSRDIRYVSLSEGVHSIVPHPVSKTMENLYGDCKDKSVLLLGLLREAGIEAVPALISTYRANPSRLRLPSAAYFDHMVVCTLERGAIGKCLDPTDPYSSAADTNADIQGNVALLLRPGSTPEIVPSDTYRWQMQVQASMQFTEEGHLEEHVKRTFGNQYGARVRAALSAANAEQAEEWARQAYHSAVSSSADPAVTIMRLPQVEEPLTLEYKTRYEDVLDIEMEDAEYYVEEEAWLRSLLGNFHVENKYSPYEFPGTRATSEYTFLLPAPLESVVHGPTLELTSPFGSLVRTYLYASPRKLKIRTVLEMPQSTIPLDKAESFNRFLDVINSETRMWFYIRPAD